MDIEKSLGSDLINLPNYGQAVFKKQWATASNAVVYNLQKTKSECRGLQRHFPIIAHLASGKTGFRTWIHIIIKLIESTFVFIYLMVKIN